MECSKLNSHFIFSVLLAMSLATAGSAFANAVREDLSAVPQGDVIAEQVSLVGCEQQVEDPNQLVNKEALAKNHCRILDQQEFENKKYVLNEKPEPADATAPGIRWKPLLLQMALFTGKARRPLNGPSLKDWKASASASRGWSDHGKFFANYAGHPAQGFSASFIARQSDSRNSTLTFEVKNRQYWKMAGIALAVSEANAMQFEVESGSGTATDQERLLNSSKVAWVNLVVTPSFGTAWMLGENPIDKRLVRWIQGHSDIRHIYVAARMLLNPSNTLQMP